MPRNIFSNDSNQRHFSMIPLVLRVIDFYMFVLEAEIFWSVPTFQILFMSLCLDILVRSITLEIFELKNKQI